MIDKGTAEVRDCVPSPTALFEFEAGSADVAWDGSEFILVEAMKGRVRGRRLSESGQEIDLEPFDIATGAEDVIVSETLFGATIAYTHTDSGRIFTRDLIVPGKRRSIRHSFPESGH